MRVNSVKRNFIFNLINTLSGLLFPLITFPYSSRIILAEGIGQVQFFVSIINYISLCTALGIPLYAVREIARVRDNKALCSKITLEILILHSLLTLIGYIIVLILVCLVSKIRVDIPLFLLLSTSLIFSTIGVSWFYQAIEDFRYVTYRAIFVRFLSLIALFVFVKNKSDLYYYASISVAAEVGNGLFNFIRLRKHIDRTLFTFKDLRILRHLKPALKIFALNLIISIYVNLDSVMLGFLSNQIAVGYYAAATKITKSVLGVVQSLGAVLLPRFSNLVSTNQMVEFERLTCDAVNFVMAISLPVTVGLIFFAAPLIHLFCGYNFEPSILTLQIMASIIIFIGVSGILGMQVLYSLGKEKIVLLSTAFGAITNFSLNWVLIPRYAQYGAGVATLVAEFFVMVIMVYFGRKYMRIGSGYQNIYNYVQGTFFMLLGLLLLKYIGCSEYTFLFIGAILSIIIYSVCLYLKRDKLLSQLIIFIKRK